MCKLCYCTIHIDRPRATNSRPYNSHDNFQHHTIYKRECGSTPLLFYETFLHQLFRCQLDSPVPFFLIVLRQCEKYHFFSRMPFLPPSNPTQYHSCFSVISGRFSLNPKHTLTSIGLYYTYSIISSLSFNKFIHE